MPTLARPVGSLSPAGRSLELPRHETQVSTYAAQGHTNKAIAYELGIARTTVATHLRTALSKLGLRRRTDIVWLYGQVSGNG